MSVVAALKNAIREIRHCYGDADPYWNAVIDTLAEWQAVATPESWERDGDDRGGRSVAA